MILPGSERDLTKKALEIIEDCNVSRGHRSKAYKVYANWQETGSQGGSLALANMLYSHIDRLAAHLFSPSDLRFTLDFENHYPKDMLAQAAVVSRILTREWERKDIDVDFGLGVKEALTYGSAIGKTTVKQNGDKIDLGLEIVMPWNFGVYNEGRNGIDAQEALCETAYLTKPEVWRRIRHLPDAERLYRRILSSAKKDEGSGPASMHSVLSTAVLDVAVAAMSRQSPGGVVDIGGDSSATLGPLIGAELFPMQELWVRDDDRENDYTTIQIIEPDILVAPRLKRVNLFCPDTSPYGLIQPNVTKNYFWGRSEVVDLMMLQEWLTSHLGDLRRLIGVQIDKILGFENVDGMTDELYGQMRGPGYVSSPQGSTIKDLTPPLPQDMLPVVQLILSLMDRVSGFPPVMSGQGEPGVRAGVHADTLVKTGSPRLRDRSLIVERQCAERGDASLAALEAKDAKAYWVTPDDEAHEFLLSQMPDDRRVSVDSHSTSPIYHDDHANLTAWGLRAGVLGPEDAIEDLPFTHKDVKLQRLKEREIAKQKLIEEHPEILTHQRGGGGRAAKIA